MNQLSEALNQQGMAHFAGDFEKAKKFFALAIAQQPFDAKYGEKGARRTSGVGCEMRSADPRRAP